MKRTVGERGQITLPKEIRQSLGVTPGSELEVSEENGAIVLRKPSLDDVLDKWAHTAENPYGSTDAYLEAVRGPAEPGVGDRGSTKKHEQGHNGSPGRGV